jgi:heptosyltransferase III
VCHRRIILTDVGNQMVPTRLSPVNILLIQLKRIGDLVLTTPAIAAVRQEFPEAKVTLIISHRCAELAPAIQGIDEILVMRPGLGAVKTLGQVARQRFDYCIDFTRNDRSAFVTLLSRARKRVVSFRIKVRSKIRARVYNEFVPHRMRDMHTIDYHLALLAPLGISNAAATVQLQLPPIAQEKATDLLQKYKVENQFIVFHPGSARLEKFWAAQYWADVIDHTGKHYDANLILTGGSGAYEQQRLREIKSRLEVPIADLSGNTDLLTLAALLSRARLLVTVDSAPMHLAAATNTPQVILFGPTNPFHWRPRESPALILQGPSTSPATEFAPKQPRIPMNQISTQAVIDAMETLLSSPAAQPSSS